MISKRSYKNFLLFGAVLIASILLCSIHSTAAVEISSPGSIVISATDEEGAPIKGIEVSLTLPMKDGMLYKSPDANYVTVDGDKADDGKKADGDVEFNVKKISKAIANGQRFVVAISAIDYLTRREEKVYSSSAVNKLNYELIHKDKYAPPKKETLKAAKPAKGDIVIAMVTRKGEPSPGFSAEVILPGDDGTFAEPNVPMIVTDGGKHDPDFALNGEVLFTQKYIGKFISDKNTFKSRIISEKENIVGEEIQETEFSKIKVNKVEFTLATSPLPPEPEKDEEADKGASETGEANKSNEKE